MRTQRGLFFVWLAAFGLMAGLSTSLLGADKPAAKVDVNSATDKELMELPGIGDAYSKKIIAGRPYKTADDLVKAGVPQKTVDKIKDQITFGAAAAKTDAKTDTKADAKTTKTDDTTAKVPPEKGMVWVNKDTKVYHKEGDRWYGKTKNGEFMTEADAIKFGARLSKQD
ncbi:MAG TPA: helix-hairpin-helix domain-containing protein [Planctomycetota bacterium]|nr:helix-hairpin-helix domain-containing protein [Planctomycetota bacterium]